ncbi:hypothetical protein GOBAR_AA35291 [Gossypium barbadense]|uniref:Auxin efflux carrier family protein n=1 Tax=Gossypium barbadense TaxID=3634 RepID=A0A2P5W2S9_GOSBA|nr:hypothetical protein GOBAR_AA35291 [Gossypium barbadense]
MGRFLLSSLKEAAVVAAATTAAAAGGQSLLGSIKIAVLPVAKVFTLCFLGFLMASKYVNIFPANGRKLLNGLVFTLLLPCLIFSQLGQAITLHKMLQWWFIPVNVFLGAVSGSIIGYVVVTLVKPPYPYFKFSIIQIAIGNIGNVPLVLIAALCRDTSNPFGDTETSPPPEGTFDNEDGNVPLKIPQKDGSPENVPLLEQEASSMDSNNSNKGKMKSFLLFVYEKLKLKQILQPPIIASILAMVIGAVPVLKKIIFTRDAPLYFFTDSCIILGKAMIPCILLALGGNLVDGPGPGSSRIGVRTLVAIIIGRLILVPPAGLGIVTLADKLGFLPADDKMFRFVLLLQHSMPTSVLSGAVANLRGYGKEAAASLFWVHIFAVFSMAGWIILYLNILF